MLNAWADGYQTMSFPEVEAALGTWAQSKESILHYIYTTFPNILKLPPFRAIIWWMVFL